jgi:hypothetical protein
MVGEGASLAHGAQLAVLRWLQGRPGDVRAILEDLAQEPFGRGWRTLFPLWHAGLGWEGEARRSLDAAAAEGFAGQRSGVEVVGLVDACTLLGDADAARLYELLLPYKDWHLAAGCAAYLAPATTTSGCWPRPRDAGGTPSGTCWRPWRRGRDSRDDHHRAEVFDAAARATRRSSSLPSDVNRGPTTSSRRHERGI